MAKERHDEGTGHCRGVVFVLECQDENEARTKLRELPFVREKLIDFDCIPLGPFAYFENLFKDGRTPG